MSISSKSSSSSSPSVQNSMRSYGSNRNNSGFDCGYSHLKCKCDILAPLQEAWREGTMDPGRRFFGCSNYKDPTKKCNFFLWADPPYSDRARDIIHQLRFKMRVKDAELQKMKEELSFSLCFIHFLFFFPIFFPQLNIFIITTSITIFFIPLYIRFTFRRTNMIHM
ncbi:hypothetical protein DCAR_0624125 [Daucus carota subsp. sativus]|uniref:GRF-type domain-containing protein n=1 Tax=Daucus carota subsp. sativus TaxID=79200 RepID=A0AAF0XAY5_DAUCS|nr:hypothetical protein DCAR_0624125 [Daucus carota subsp. sativus]